MYVSYNTRKKLQNKNQKKLTELSKKSALYYRGQNRGEEMNDNRIIELFWNRDESAVSALSEKYGKYLAAVSRNILENEEYTEDCVNDTLLEVWESIQPNRPARLSAFIGRIARNNALNMLEKFRAKRRGSGERELVLDELGKIASATQMA